MSIKDNILIDQTGRACLADFGLLRIVSDGTNSTSSNSFLQGGTCRWMSPELLDPEKFDLKDGRQTKRSDCYALGMVIYEVLSRRLPFSRHHKYAIIARILEGERPGRPGGEEGTWFTDDIWSTLDCCWRASPGDRPSVKGVLQCLEEASMSWTPPSPHTAADPPTSLLGRNSESSTEESTEEDEVPPTSEVISSRQSQELRLKGDPNASNIYPSGSRIFSSPSCRS